MDAKVQDQDSFKLIANYATDLATDNFNVLGTFSMIARSDVPASHIKVADNFMLIKKLFSFSAVKSKISFEEKKLLAKHNFNVLESSTISEIQTQILTLKSWSESGDKRLQKASEEIMQLRAKELKYLISTSFSDITDPKFNGYKALERYFAIITKY